SNLAGRIGPVLLERLFGGTGVQSGREQRLRDRIVEVASYSAALLECTLPLSAMRLRKRFGGSLSLGDQRAQKQGRQRSNDDVELRAQSSMVDWLSEERPHLMGGDPDRHQRSDRDGDGRSGWSQPKRSEDQCREDHVGDRALGGDRDERERCDERGQEKALPATHTPPSCGWIRRRDGQHGTATESTAGAPDPPGAPDLRALGNGDPPSREHRNRPDDGADRSRSPYRAEQAAHLLGPVEGRARADQPPQKPRTDEDFGEIPRLLADEASQRQGGEELTIDDRAGEQGARA